MTPPTLQKISDHIYWLPPSEPDRPSLCAVVGSEKILMLDAGASAAHTRLFLDMLQAAGVRYPDYVMLTHWHWDHVFGAAMITRPLIAQTQTASHLAVQAAYEWTDAALDERVQRGEEIVFCADNIKLELPEPREVSITLPDILFHERLTLQLGDVSCHLQHVGGDHAADSSIVYIEPDCVLFLGDCLYDAIYTPARHYTTAQLFPLLDKVLAYDARLYIEGHTDTVMTRAEIETMAAKMRLAGSLVEQHGTDEAAVLAAIQAQSDLPLDEDMTYFVGAFIAGYKLKNTSA